MTKPEPRWPWWIWSLQLLPAAFLLTLGLWIMNAPNPSDGAEVTALAIAGGTWMIAVVAVLCAPRGRRWLIGRRAEWGLCAIVVLLCLVVADVASTVMGIVPTIAQRRSHSLSFADGAFTKNRLTPRTVLVQGGAPMRINRRGFRGPEIAVDKTPGQPRIVFLGGSQVFDYWNEAGWPAMVGEELQARNHPVEIINAAVPGHDSTDSLGKLMTDLWTLEPDVIVLCNAWNDIKYFSRVSPERPYRGLPPEEPQPWRADWRIYPKGLDWVLSASAIYRCVRWWVARSLYVDGAQLGAQLPTVESWFARPKKRSPQESSSAAQTRQFGPWGLRQYRLNLELIADLARHTGAVLVLCRQAHLATKDETGLEQGPVRSYGTIQLELSRDEAMRAFELVYDTIDQVAAQTGALVVDMDRQLSGRGAYFADGIHFTLAGSRAAAQLVAAAIEPLVSEIGER